jgi:hypothetical protein
MRRARSRYRLWQIMVGIAVLAGLFAVFDVTVIIAILVVISVLVLPVVLARPGLRLRTAAWVSSLYPVFLISSAYATWFAAWAALGRRPQITLDDPKFIGPLVDVPLYTGYLLMFGLWGAAVACILLVLAYVAQGVGRDEVRAGMAVVQLLIPVLLWASPFILSLSNALALDYVLEWFLD